MWDTVRDFFLNHKFMDVCVLDGLTLLDTLNLLLFLQASTLSITQTVWSLSFTTALMEQQGNLLMPSSHPTGKSILMTMNTGYWEIHGSAGKKVTHVSGSR